MNHTQPNLLNPKLPSSNKEALYAGQLYGSAQGLLLAKAAQQHDGPLLVITDDMNSAHRLELEAKFLDETLSQDDITALSDKLQNIITEIETKEERWLELMEKMEQ